MTVLVNALVQRGASSGGFNYSLAGHSKLFPDSKHLTIGISNIDPISMLSAVWAGVSINSFTMAADVQSVMNTQSDLLQLSEDELWRMVALLIAGPGV